MSTRRARIKAVTALPPRRKNVPTSENKSAAEKESIQAKSPLKPVENDKETPLSPQENANSKSPAGPLDTEKEVSKTKEACTPKPVSQNIFASPLARNSPKRAFASPNLPSPKRIANTIELPTSRTPIRQPTPKHHEPNQNTELQVASDSVSNIQPNARHEDRNVQSLSDNINDAMDGIVPLKPTQSAPKPIEKLKNEIISENAEVVFDPIVPLPSPSKVRPKLRPVPRLGPRRNSIQGSASESEDESRRSLLSGGNTPGPRQRHDSHSTSILQSMLNREVSRVRNDSVCSSVSQLPGSQTPASPLKDKSQKSRRAQEMANRRAAMAASRKRRQMKREAMTMYDLIFYNPSDNPIIPDEDEVKAKEENTKELEKQKLELKQEQKTEPVPEVAPAPQIKLGPNGEIVLDEASLVINQTQHQKISGVVREGAWLPTQGSYKRAPRTADWSAPETVRFYRALAAIGTDFTLMAPLFPDRTRRDLKIKFKKEERLNGAQVDKALRSRISWDAMSLKEEFTVEREEAKKKAEEEKRREKELYERQKKEDQERLKTFRPGQKRSRSAKVLEISMNNEVSSVKRKLMTANDLVERAELNEKLKKPNPVTQTKQTPNVVPIPRTPQFVNRTPQTTPSNIIQKTPNNNAPIERTPNNPSIQKTPIDLSSKERRTPQNEHPKTPSPSIARLTINRRPSLKNTPDMATLTKNTPNRPQIATSLTNIPSNIETGSLIVLTVNNPKSPGKKMLQTYIAHEPGKLTQVALPPTFLNSVVGYMKKGKVSENSSPLSHDTGDSRGSTPKINDTKRSSPISIMEL